MTNREKFLAGKWFIMDELDPHKVNRYSLCLNYGCIQGYLENYECMCEINEKHIKISKSVMHKIYSSNINFSDMIFIEDEETQKI